MKRKCRDFDEISATGSNGTSYSADGDYFVKNDIFVPPLLISSHVRTGLANERSRYGISQLL